MTELIESIVKAIVDEPEKVEVKQVQGETTLIFEVKVSPEDVGKVIGKKGRTINAVRTLLRVVAIKENKKIMLELI